MFQRGPPPSGAKQIGFLIETLIGYWVSKLIYQNLSDPTWISTPELTVPGPLSTKPSRRVQGWAGQSAAVAPEHGLTV